MITFILINIAALYIFVTIHNNTSIYDRFESKSFYLLCFFIVLVIGFRGEGVDHDYPTYLSEMSEIQSIPEPTFLLLRYIIIISSLPLTAIFLIYALLGVSIKFYAIKKYSNIELFALIIYFSNILLLHDITQIRAGVASGLFLLSIGNLLNKKKFQFVVIILLASLFHFSSLCTLPLIFISNSDITKKQRSIVWFTLPIIGIIFHLFHFDVFNYIPFENIRLKMEMYKGLEQVGTEGYDKVNLFNLYFIFKACIYYYLLYNYRYFKRYADFNILFKIFGISLFLFHSLSSITPILGYRIYDFYGTVEIFLFPILFVKLKTKKQIEFSLIMYYLLLLFVNIYHKQLIMI